MSFTALHPVSGRIDATLADLGQGLEWESVHRTRPRIRLTCPECGHGVHAKLSPRRTRYFAHDPGRSPDCSLSGESADHHLLKVVLAEAIRSAGWQADVELPAPDGSWRADVMATSPANGHQIAWEAQLSPITDADIQMRTDRYASDGIDVCWVSSRDRVPWLSTVPAIAVTPADPQTPADRWMVHDGLVGFDYAQGSWTQINDVALTTFVRWVLDSSLAFHPIGRRYRRIRLPGSNAIIRRSASWTTQRSIDAETRHEVMRREQEAAKAEREERERQAKEHRNEVERERKRQEDERRRAENAERHRVFMLELERDRVAWEARRREQERQQQEEAQKQEAAVRERDRREQAAAQQWWEGVSASQLTELLQHITALSLSEHASRAFPHSEERSREHAYGLALYTGHRLYGVARPCPYSLELLPASARIFVRNAREKALITASGHINPDLVTHFDLPDHEQTTLI